MLTLTINPLITSSKDQAGQNPLKALALKSVASIVLIRKNQLFYGKS